MWMEALTPTLEFRQNTALQGGPMGAFFLKLLANYQLTFGVF